MPSAFRRVILLLLVLAGAVGAQQAVPTGAATAATSSSVTSGPAGSDSPATPAATPVPADFEPNRFDWVSAARQSFHFLALQHSFRLVQPKTRRELGGPFFEDWKRSIQGIRGWRDGDSMFTNYVAHPMQGGVSGYIQIQNDPRGKKLEISRSKDYWQSRMRAMGFAALYSTNFEIGLMSEATIGNVGKKRGTTGVVDLVVTPAGSVGMIVAEDWLDRYVVRRLESRTSSLNKRRFYRMLFNPQRGFANLVRGKLPWHRDTRPLHDGSQPPLPGLAPTSTIATSKAAG